LLDLPPEYLHGHEQLLLNAIQDLNWPGAHLFIELLSRLPVSDYLQLYLKDFEEAKRTGDELWTYALYLLGQKINLSHQLDDIVENIKRHLVSQDFL